jgi:hypothetical protein
MAGKAPHYRTEKWFILLIKNTGVPDADSPYYDMQDMLCRYT